MRSLLVRGESPALLRGLVLLLAVGLFDCGPISRERVKPPKRRPAGGGGGGVLLPPANQTAPCPMARYKRQLPSRAFEFPQHRTILPSAGAIERMPLQRLLSTKKAGNYSIAFTSFAAGEPYSTTQARHVETARRVGGVDVTYAWSKAQLLQTEWGQRVLRRFYAVFSKHARWVWKPYVIWDALNRMQEGDFVVYLDASRFFRKGFEQSVVPLTNFLYANRRGAIDMARLSYGMVPGLRLKERNRSRWFWPYKCQLCEMLTLMGLCTAPDDNECCLSYWNAPHVQASFSIWQKNAITMKFVETWLLNCEDMEVLRRSKQGDQCVSSIIATAYSRELGLKVPWIYLPNLPNGNKLKDPGLLFGRFLRAELPPFLRESEPYPECAHGPPAELYDNFMCYARRS